MKFRKLLVYIILVLTSLSLTGCALGMLLFYRDSKTVTVYKSSDSKKNYYIVKATTLSHCGCTELYIDNFKNGHKDFTLFYNDKVARKTIYKFDSKRNITDTISLIAISSNNYTIDFDSLDIAIFKRIDTIATYKPKGIIYKVKQTDYKGFLKASSYKL